MFVKRALARGDSRIISRTSLDNLTRLQQERLRIVLVQQSPIAKVREQMYEQLPPFRACWQLNIVVLHPVHDQSEHRFTLLLPNANERDDSIEDRILEMQILQTRAKLVALD